VLSGGARFDVTPRHRAGSTFRHPDSIFSQRRRKLDAHLNSHQRQGGMVRFSFASNLTFWVANGLDKMKWLSILVLYLGTLHEITFNERFGIVQLD
jgi:hypothetical protein